MSTNSDADTPDETQNAAAAADSEESAVTEADSTTDTAAAGPDAEASDEHSASAGSPADDPAADTDEAVPFICILRTIELVYFLSYLSVKIFFFSSNKINF